MKIILTCGGTGGHITPALAIADIIKQNLPTAELLFVGSRRGMEVEWITREGYPFEALEVEGLSRSLTLHNLSVLKKALVAVSQAREMLLRHRPSLVIGTGGYACYPMLKAAARQGIPCAVHESNACPGLAVRRLAPCVDRVWLSFPEAAGKLSHRAQVRVVGNPVACASAPSKVSDGAHRVLSFGGSLGADALNRAVLDLMEREAVRKDVTHLHATGRRSYERVREEFEKRGLAAYPTLRLVPFIEDMPRQMASATLVICRAGAMTLGELAANRLPAVLVPSPNVTGDHQYKNAKAFSNAGAAVLIEEAELGKRLPEAVLHLLDHVTEREALSRAVAAFATPDAGRLIWSEIRALLGQTVTN